jgi:hypothetical protein
MTDDYFSIELVERSEAEVAAAARARLAELLSYFQSLQDAVWICLRNQGEPIALKNVSGNPKPFAVISTMRSLGLARVAMEITLRGYPLEGMGLSRTLLELAECTQYLVRHPELIDRFLRGKLKIGEVIKKAKAEQKRPEGTPLTMIWRILSPFAHASPNSLALILSAEGEKQFTASLLINNSKIIDDTAFGICAAHFAQYYTFRSALGADVIVTDKLKSLDSALFERDALKKHAGLGSMELNILEDFRSSVLHDLDAID